MLHEYVKITFYSQRINYLTHFYVQTTCCKKQFVGDNCTYRQTKTEYSIISYLTFHGGTKF